ncbi:class I SAM-dependent methyltransferase, partial [bacterium]|nr:class I SAM-dependent methyltransferase [bacterium]
MNSGESTLNEKQLAHYDRDYYAFRSIWPPLFRFFERDFPNGDFHLLDVGGGAGRFADYLLARYPASCATVLDMSPRLLERNRPDVRKWLMLGDAIRLDELHLSRDIDVVSFNFVLHHLLARDEVSSRRLRCGVLRQAARLLRKGGRILIIEPLYHG